jgi:hypothetical protein
MNPYQAPETALTEVASHEIERAMRLRAGFVREERNVRSLAWLNILFAAIVGIVTVEVAAEPMQTSWNFARIRVMAPIIIIYGSSLVWLNLWIWYSLRRLSPLARWAAIVEATGGILIGFVVAGFLLAEGGPFAGALIVFLLISMAPSLFLYLLISKRVRMLFESEYQDALTLTRHRRIDRYQIHTH